LHVVKIYLCLCRLMENVVLDSEIYRERRVDMNNIWKEKFRRWNKG
jgi:hypothetical protein